MSQLAILIAIYCVNGGQSPWAKILQKFLHHFSLVSSYFLHVQAVQQPCKWGKDKSATCGEGQPWMADLSCRSLWEAAISYSLCFIIITKAEAISELLMPWIFVHVVSKPFLSWNAVVAVLTLGVCRHYHHDLSNHLQIHCVSRLLEKCGKVV